MQRHSLLSLAVSAALGGALPAVYAQADEQPDARGQGAEQERFLWDRNEFQLEQRAMAHAQIDGRADGRRHVDDRRFDGPGNHGHVSRGEIRHDRREIRQDLRDLRMGVFIR